MADFGDNFDQVAEVDPAAEFLAREQAELGGVIDDDFKFQAAPFQPVNGDGAPIDVLKENSGSSFEMIDGLEQDGLEAPKEMNSELYSFENKIENDFADQLSYEHDFGREVSPSPPLQRQEVREEPEKIKKWREDQIKRLEEKDKEEEKKREEWREIAKKELDDWYKNHEETIAKTKAANRDAAKNAEKQFVADDKEIEPGTEWERIAKLCDFNPKAKQGSKDVSRLRSLILQLKQSPLPVNSA